MTLICDLPVIESSPGSQHLRFMLLYVLAGMEDTGRFERSRRLAQEDLVRVGGTRVSRNLSLLVQDNWLTEEEKGKSGVGTIYTPGTRLLSDPALAETWRKWARTLLRDDGLLKKWIGTDVLAYRDLGMPGLLVAYCIDQGAGELDRTAVRRLVAPFVNRGVCDARLSRLLASELAVEDSDGHLAMLDGWQEAVVATSVGVATRIHAQVTGEREAHLEKIGVPPERLRLKRAAKGQPCARCGTRSNELDHHPPASWGGFDHALTTRPICRKCNGSTSAIIRDWGPPRTPVRLVIPVGVDVEATLPRLFAAHGQFLDRAFDCENRNGAHRSASTMTSIFKAASAGSIRIMRTREVPASKVRASGARSSRRARPARRVKFEDVSVDLDSWDELRIQTSPRTRKGLRK